MFHISNIGPNALAAQFADINGYVPEAGDNWRDMNYDLGMDCPKRWERKVEEAIAELNELYCTYDHDGGAELEEQCDKAQCALNELEREYANILAHLDNEWWPALVRDAVAATVADSTEIAAI